MGEILVIDLSGGPKFVVGDTFENHTISRIDMIDNIFFITLK